MFRANRSPFTFAGRLLSSLLLGLVLVTTGTSAETLQIQSPDKKITVEVTDKNNQPQYRVTKGNEEIVSLSQLGLVFAELPEFISGFTIDHHKRSSVNAQWEQPWGERRVVKDNHNELLVQFVGTDNSPVKGKPYHFTMRFRVFNDGIGFRYELPEQPGSQQVKIVDEITEFRVVPESKAWWVPARGWNRYEYIYKETTVEDIDRVHTPFTFRLPTGTHVSIHEAALVDYAAFSLDQQRRGVLKTELTPWYDGIKVRSALPLKSSWRTIQIADQAVELLNSDLILNLNEPNKLGDVSWVNPGKYIGIWWAMHVAEKTWASGVKHGATTADTKRYIDFAAKYGFDGVLVEGWNIGWDGDWFFNGDLFSFTKNYPDFNIHELAKYAKSKGVKLIGHHETSGAVTNYRNQMADAFDLYEALEIEQVKTGYVADGGRIKRIDDKGIVRHEWHHGQFMVGEYLHSITEAAKHKISINTHEPIKDTGLRRTYPNWISREGARGQEFNAWGSPPNPPEHTTILPYTRMLSGPMDFTPGIFEVAPTGVHSWNRVNTTVAKQLALYVVLYSPIQMAADLLRHYEKRTDVFQFIRDVPTDWEQSIALDGEVGEFVVFARKVRDGQDWYVGAITNAQGRKLTLDTRFLDEGVEYEAQIYQDGPGAHYKETPYPVEIKKQKITKNQKILLQLAASGGTAIRFKAL